MTCVTQGKERLEDGVLTIQADRYTSDIWTQASNDSCHLRAAVLPTHLHDAVTTVTIPASRYEDGETEGVRIRCIKACLYAVSLISLLLSNRTHLKLLFHSSQGGIASCILVKHGFRRRHCSRRLLHSWGNNSKLSLESVARQVVDQFSDVVLMRVEDLTMSGQRPAWLAKEDTHIGFRSSNIRWNCPHFSSDILESAASCGQTFLTIGAQAGCPRDVAMMS
jgi:hypothetical protein